MDSLQNGPRDGSSSGPAPSPPPQRLNGTPSPSWDDAADLENALLWTLREPGTVALTLLYSLSFLLGFAGNLTSLRVLAGRRGRRLAAVGATRGLLLNLAVCDLAVVCVCMPITLASRIYAAWVYGDLLCRAVPFTQAVSVAASVLTLSVISVNRYYGVRSPLRARSVFTRRRVLATVAAVWAASSAVCAPIAVVNRRREIGFGGFSIPVCQEEWPEHRLKQGYNVLLFAVLYCLPVTFNLTIGFLTGRRLRGGTRTAFADLDPRSRALHASRLKTRQKIAKTVVCLVLLFAVSWLPLYVADLWIDRELRPPPWLLQTRPFAQWLGLTNSSLNPICYCFIGDLYRSAKVIRTRYYQKVAALFGDVSFVTSGAEASPTAAAATERDHVTAPLGATASAATVPRLLSLARAQGAGQRVSRTRGVSDRRRSGPSAGERNTPLAWDPAPGPFRLDLLPSRRHSAHDGFGPLPPRLEAGNDTLPAGRRSGVGRSALCSERT
ncbi:galanin receptor type 1-like [Hippocampus zosterae]|uniref:galanin receptor type 1-like n=1 Tax=Hippocampus zosterae TaxID=109293 RepID=UPI00223D655B|nr:galanin receptor type 1-like [Hippocampus zosterae]